LIVYKKTKNRKGGTEMFSMKTITKLVMLLMVISIAFTQTVVMQGVLRAPSGETVADNFYSLTFKVYDVAISGEALWTEAQGSVNVQHGVFSVELGSVTPMNTLTFSTQYFVGISVEGGPELEPRIKLASVPTSFGVLGVDNVFPSSGNVGVGTADPQAFLHIEQIGDDQDLLKIENGTFTLKVTSEGVMHIPEYIEFSDGSVLQTAAGGSADALSTAGDAIIISDNDSDGDGDIKFKIGNKVPMVIKNATDNTSVHISSPSAGSYAAFRFLDENTQKWYLGKDSDNSLAIWKYDANGANGANKMVFWDNEDISLYGGIINLNGDSGIFGTLGVSGNTNLSGTLGVSGNTDITGTLDVNSLIKINATAGSTAALRFLDGDTQKWYLGKDTDNSLTIHKYDANGANGGSKMVFWSNENISLYGPSIYLNGDTHIDGDLDISGKITSVLEVNGLAGINLNSPDDSNSLLRFQDGGVSKFALIARSTDDLFGIYDYTAGFDRMQFWGSDIEMQFADATDIGFGKRDGDVYNDCSIFPLQSNNGNIGTPNNYWYEVHANRIFSSSQHTLSDRSTKLNIRSLVENRSNLTNLDKVLALNPIKYDINIDTHPFYKNVVLKKEDLEDSKDNLGFIAQELMEVIPEMVSFSKSQQLYSIRNYEQMFPVLVGAMQEMKAENDDLKSRIERLEASIGE